MAGLKDARDMVKAGRIIANFCRIRGWCPAWGDLTDEERDQFIGVAETIGRSETRDAQNRACQNAVAFALLDALALLLVGSEERMAKSNFREFLDHNEFGLALEELNEVVRNDL